MPQRNEWMTDRKGDSLDFSRPIGRRIAEKQSGTRFRGDKPVTVRIIEVQIATRVPNWDSKFDGDGEASGTFREQKTGGHDCQREKRKKIDRNFVEWRF